MTIKAKKRKKESITKRILKWLTVQRKRMYQSSKKRRKMRSKKSWKIKEKIWKVIINCWRHSQKWGPNFRSHQILAQLTLNRQLLKTVLWIILKTSKLSFLLERKKPWLLKLKYWVNRRWKMWKWPTRMHPSLMLLTHSKFRINLRQFYSQVWRKLKMGLPCKRNQRIKTSQSCLR